mgnify:CR=1 FL=1
MEFIRSNIVFSTIHGAKGLEWDFVILPDLEKSLFPSWNALCGLCRNQKCSEVFTTNDEEFEEKFLEELSIFYVAVTRAKKSVYFTASKKSVNDYGGETKLSCFLKLQGINLVSDT